MTRWRTRSRSARRWKRCRADGGSAPNDRQLFRGFRRIHRPRLKPAQIRQAEMQRPAVGLLPDRLEAVHVALAGLAFVAPIEAAVERAGRAQRIHVLFDFGPRQVALAAGAAELQHEGCRGAFAGLWAVECAFREI